MWLHRICIAVVALVIGYAGTAFATKVDIVINKVSQKMTVKIDGETEYVWLVSTGASGYDTPGGTYRPFRMEEDHFSKEWDDAPMPHSIFFTGAGHAIHGSFYVKSLGRRASHGCVRLHPDNAETLYSLVKSAGMSNTSVTVRGGFFDFGSSKRRSFASIGEDIENTIKKATPKKKPKKVALKCTTKNGKKTCRKPFQLFGGIEG